MSKFLDSCCSALLLALALLPSHVVFAQAPVPSSPDIDRRVDALLRKMTLEEKLDYIGGTGFAVRRCQAGLRRLKMRRAARSAQSKEISVDHVRGRLAWRRPGIRNWRKRVGAGIGKDARARGIHFMLGPGVNIYRAPMNGRNFEYFGEDPFLASSIAVGYITGMQKQGVSSTVKHFLGNNSEFLRHDSDSIIDERALREIYLPTFESAVKNAHVARSWIPTI